MFSLAIILSSVNRPKLRLMLPRIRILFCPLTVKIGLFFYMTDIYQLFIHSVDAFNDISFISLKLRFKEQREKNRLEKIDKYMRLILKIWSFIP